MHGSLHGTVDRVWVESSISEHSGRVGERRWAAGMPPTAPLLGEAETGPAMTTRQRRRPHQRNDIRRRQSDSVVPASEPLAPARVA
jgi:hypothetical protein